MKNVGLTNFRAVAFHIDEFHETKNRSNVNICATESIGNDSLVQFPKNSSVPADLRNSMLSNFNDIPIGNDWLLLSLFCMKNSQQWQWIHYIQSSFSTLTGAVNEFPEFSEFYKNNDA